MSTEKEKQWQKDRRKRLLEQGLCTCCGKRVAAESKTRCENCAKKMSTAVSKSRTKLKPIRQSQGLCYCGNVALPGKKLCEKCRVRGLNDYYKDKSLGKCAYCGLQAIDGLTRCQLCIDKARLKSRALKTEVFNAYGGFSCVCCKETHPLLLTLDHINNDGNKHRLEVGRTSVYRKLKQQDFPPGYQVLCFNCNIGRHLNGGICPHHQP